MYFVLGGAWVLSVAWASFAPSQQPEPDTPPPMETAEADPQPETNL